MKVKCCDCVNESKRKCLVKEVTINPGKHRRCDSYEFDQAGELVRLKRSASIRNRYDKRQAAYSEFLSGQKVADDDTKTKHPVTGDLNRFKAGV